MPGILSYADQSFIAAKGRATSISFFLGGGVSGIRVISVRFERGHCHAARLARLAGCRGFGEYGRLAGLKLGADGGEAFEEFLHLFFGHLLGGQDVLDR